MHKPVVTIMAFALLAGCGEAARDDGPGGAGADAPLADGSAAADGTDAIEIVPGSPSPIDDAPPEADEPAPQAEPVISEPFRGRWAKTLDGCRKEPAGARIIIGASEVQFEKLTGDPLVVTQLGDRSISVNLRLVAPKMVAERTDRMTIDPDGNSLLYFKGDVPTELKRCPT